MIQDEAILKQIGMEGAPEAEQRAALDQLQTFIGEAISATLSEQQLNEYQAIIDDDTEVIDAWLESTIPDYKNAALYQEFAEGFDSDPEQNSPEKLFATVAWIELNVPNRQAIVDEVIANFKPE